VENNGLDFDAIAGERAAASEAIVNSEADKRLIVAGPGTGKTYTFKEALSKAILDSGTAEKGLALTFIRNLVADLAEALSDVADVFTFHGFCKHLMHRHAVAGLQEGWDYYSGLIEVIWRPICTCSAARASARTTSSGACTTSTTATASSPTR
jgi:hypothetical protein